MSKEYMFHPTIISRSSYYNDIPILISYMYSVKCVTGRVQLVTHLRSLGRDEGTGEGREEED